MLLYLNDQWLEPSKAHISPFDRGFLFGDGVYEVTPIYYGQYFYLDAHIARLQQSMDLTGIKTGWQQSQWLELHRQLVQRNNLNKNQAYQCYLQVTRGCDGSRHHIIDPNTKPTIMAMLSPQASYSQKSIALISQEDYRWSRCDIKSTALLGNVLLLDHARQQQADETLLHRNGIITEAASANVFIVIDGVIHTPQLKHELLPGITRKIILDLAKQLEIKTITRDIDLSDLGKAQEVWISSSTRTLMPCHRVDQYSYEAPGPIGSAIQQAYQQHIQDHCVEKVL